MTTSNFCYGGNQEEDPMPIRAHFIAHLACILGSGLIAGTFLAFSSFIMAAFVRLPAAQGIEAMQAINITVINPLFMAVLFGTALLGGYLGYISYQSGVQSWTAAGAAIYVFGAIGVTLAMNVPLNNELAVLDPAMPESAQVWARYLRDWTFWNSVRGMAAAAACIAFAVSL
jgi:uncharacterized membrane protein